MTAPIHIILNPAAGSGGGRRARSEIEREFTRRGIGFTLEETSSAGSARALAQAAARRGTRTIIAAGGDGTIHDVVNGLLEWRDESGSGSLPVLGIIPVGTGNDFVKSVHGGTDRQLAYRIIARGVFRYFDLGRVTWAGGSEYFTNGVGTGIDVEVVRQIARLTRLPGLVRYLVGLFKALRHFRPIPLEISIDGRVITRKVMIAAVGNGFCLGGGFHLFPGARADDGQLDLCVVDELNLPGIAVVLPRILRGRHLGDPRVTLQRGSTVEILARGEAGLFFQVDGELREPEGVRSLRVGIEKAILPVFADLDLGTALKGGDQIAQATDRYTILNPELSPGR